jgi:aspartyl protease family protein
VRRRLLWILLIGLVLAVAVLLARHDYGGTIAGIPTGDAAAALYYAALIVFLGGSVVVLFRDRFSQALEALLFWTVISLVLVLGYTFRMELRDVADRVMSELIPGRVATRSVNNVEISRGRAGDFQVAAQINGVRISMILDTGASAVVLTQEAAKAAGLPLEVLSYDVAVDTANGRTRAAAVTLDRITVGGIVERSVPALIAQPGQLRRSLLGMSFLNRLESWEVRGDKLVMRGQP